VMTREEDRRSTVLNLCNIIDKVLDLGGGATRTRLLDALASVLEKELFDIEASKAETLRRLHPLRAAEASGQLNGGVLDMYTKNEEKLI
jgi:hypothetical protein